MSARQNPASVDFCITPRVISEKARHLSFLRKCTRHSRLRAGIQVGWGMDSRLRGSDDNAVTIKMAHFRPLMWPRKAIVIPASAGI